MKKIAIIFGIAVTALAYCGFITPKPASNKVIVAWLKLQQTLIRNTKKVPHVAYTRHFAYTSVALYEAVTPSDQNYRSLTGQLQGLKTVIPSPGGELSWEASANSCLATMFRHFYGQYANNSTLIDSLENSHHTQLISDNQSAQVNAGEAFGKKVANEIITWSKEDGEANASASYQIPEGESFWVKTPPTFGNPAVPFWSRNRTMVANHVQSLLKSPSVEFSSAVGSNFYAAAREVYDISKNETDEQKKIALFWDDSPNGKYLSVFGHWSAIFTQVVESRKMSLAETAVAFAKLALAQHDASIMCWTGKYRYNVMRPVTYINKYIDKSWTPLIETPPHPEYPAAHATLSAAAATALEAMFGKNCSFTDRCYESIGHEARSYPSFENAAKEAGMSRLYGGIHYRSSIESGYELGVKTAQHVLTSIKFRKQSQ